LIAAKKENREQELKTDYDEDVGGQISPFKYLLDDSYISLDDAAAAMSFVVQKEGRS
jgi:hypothetical protein